MLAVAVRLAATAEVHRSTLLLTPGCNRSTDRLLFVSMKKVGLSMVVGGRQVLLV